MRHALVSLAAVAALLEAAPALAQAPSEPTLAAATEKRRLLTSELSVGVGGLGSSIAYEGGGRWGDFLIAPVVEGRWLFGGLAVDGTLMITVPTEANGTLAGGTLTARVGWSGRRWAVLVGAAFQTSPGADPALQVLPSIQARVGFYGGWGLTLGVVDTYALALAHLDVNYGNFSLGYVAPLGAQASAKLKLGDAFSVKVQGMLVAAGPNQVALLTVQGAFGPSAGGQGGVQ